MLLSLPLSEGALPFFLPQVASCWAIPIFVFEAVVSLVFSGMRLGFVPLMQVQFLAVPPHAFLGSRLPQASAKCTPDHH